MCGGFFLEQLNQSVTTCHDGRTAAQCYTPVLDWSNTNLTEAQQGELTDAARASTGPRQVRAIVAGSFDATNSTTPRPDLGKFVVTEAWIAEGDGAASGAFVHVKDNGRVCFAAPCPNLTETTLNTSQVANIAEVNFAPAGLIADEVAECTASIYGPVGLLVAGERYTVEVDGRTAPGRTATQAFRQLGVDAP